MVQGWEKEQGGGANGGKQKFLGNKDVQTLAISPVMSNNTHYKKFNKPKTLIRPLEFHSQPWLIVN